MQNIEERISAIIRRVSKTKPEGALPVDADVFRELGVESTAALDLLFSIEDEFGISVPDDQFSTARTVRKMTELIAALQGSA
jgi:acyl carrier protein